MGDIAADNIKNIQDSSAILDDKTYQEARQPSPIINHMPQYLPQVLKIDHIAASEDYNPVPPAKDQQKPQPDPPLNVTVSDNILPGNTQLNVRRSSYIQDLVELRRRELKEKKAWLQNGMMGALGFCVMMYLQSVETYSGL